MTATLAAVACLALGVPLARLVFDGRVRVWTFVATSAAIGLAVWMLLGLAAMQLGQFTAVGLGGAGLAVAVAAGAAGRRGGQSFEVAQSRLELGGLAALGALAVWSRRHPVEFVFEIGDMGEYVNWAHRVAGGEAIAGSFPHGLPVAMALTQILPGQSPPVAAVPLMGMLLWCLAVALLVELRVSPLVRVGLAAVLAVHPHAIWFAIFPASESLIALLVLLWFVLLHRSLGAGGRPAAVAAGLTMGAAILVRGDSIFLILPLLAWVLWLTRAADGKAVHDHGPWLVVSAASSQYAGLMYDLEMARTYFLRQIEHRLGGERTEAIVDAGLASVSPVSLLLLAAAVAAVLGARALARQTAAGASAPSPREPLAWMLGTLLGAVPVLGITGLADALRRYDALLLGLVVLGTLAVYARRHRRDAEAVGLVAWATLWPFVLLFAARLPDARNHDFYLYWDRYLVGVALPAFIVLAALGAEAAYAELSRRRGERLAAGALILAMAAGLAQLVGHGAPLREDVMFRGAYRDLAALDELIGDPRDVPVLYSGLPRRPPSWGFPNTIRAYALPLAQVWKRNLVNAGGDPFRKDPVLDAAALQRTLLDGDIPRARVVLLAPRARGCPLPTLYRARELGELRTRVPWLKRRIDREEEVLRYAPLRFLVCDYELALAQPAYDVGSADVRPLLVGGWGSDEAEVSGRTFAWAVGERPGITIDLPADAAHELTFQLRTTGAGAAAGQTLRIRVNGTEVGSVYVTDRFEKATVLVPASAVAAGADHVQFEPSWRRTPPDGPGDPRRLSFALDRVEAVPVEL